jgi:hypothetical protein
VLSIHSNLLIKADTPKYVDRPPKYTAGTHSMQEKIAENPKESHAPKQYGHVTNLIKNESWVVIQNIL